MGIPLVLALQHIRIEVEVLAPFAHAFARLLPEFDPGRVNFAFDQPLPDGIIHAKVESPPTDWFLIPVPDISDHFSHFLLQEFRIVLDPIHDLWLVSGAGVIPGVNVEL